MRQLALRDPDEITGNKMCSPRFAASQVFARARARARARACGRARE